MLKIKVIEKSGASIEYQSEQMIDPSALGHGLPERLVPESEARDPADVLAVEQVEVSPAVPAVLDGEGNVLEVEVPAVIVPYVRLKAEYTIEVQDITAQLEQEHINREALEYLTSTDWMAIRASEGGKPMPEEIKQARAEARARIVR